MTYSPAAKATILAEPKMSVKAFFSADYLKLGPP